MDSTNSITKRPLVIYHGNCADGFGAAWCFWNYSSGTYEFHPGVYGQEPPDCTGKIVYLVDFSYKKETVKKICAEADFVYFIDHHVSAIKDLEPLSNPLSEEYQKNFQAVTAIDSSGAMLAWNFLHNGLAYNEPIDPTSEYYYEPPLLLSYIEDRDLWKFKLEGSREVASCLFSYDYNFNHWDSLILSGMTTIDAMKSAGSAIERKHMKDIKELLAVAKRAMVIGTYKVPVASMPYTMASDAGNIMATEFMKGTKFAATYYDTAEARKFSLRSVKDIGMDVSIVAGFYGGGGHKNAAGFSVPRTHLLALL